MKCQHCKANEARKDSAYCEECAPNNKPGRKPFPDGEAADSQIHLRVTRARKAAYVRDASAKGETLVKYIFRLCDKESGYQGK